MFNRIKNNPARATIRLPRLGKIRLGKKAISKKTGHEHPIETDYFVCPPEVQSKFGPEPKSLLVMLPTENEEMVYRQYYSVYGGNQKLLCQGDGETAERRVDGKIEKIPCPGPAMCEFAKDPNRAGGEGKLRCSARTDIMLVLPTVNVGGVYQLSSGSIHSDIDMRSGIEMARLLYKRISWVPMQIIREEQKIADPATGKMNPHWPVKLYPIGDIAGINESRKDNSRIIDVSAQYIIPEPQIEGPEFDTPIDYTDEDAPRPAGPQTEEEKKPELKPVPIPPPPESEPGWVEFCGDIERFLPDHGMKILGAAGYEQARQVVSHHQQKIAVEWLGEMRKDERKIIIEAHRPLLIRLKIVSRAETKATGR